MTFCIAGTAAADENTAADYSYLCSVFAIRMTPLDIEASEDGKTFTAHLNAPCAYFLDLCAFPAFYPVPQQAVEAADGADTNPGAWALEAGFVGSGPFVLTEWKHNESMTYEPTLTTGLLTRFPDKDQLHAEL